MLRCVSSVLRLVVVGSHVPGTARFQTMGSFQNCPMLLPPESQSSTMGFLSAAEQKATEVEAHEGCRLVLRVGVPSGMSGLPSGGHTSRAVFPLVSPACIMQPFPHTCEVLYRYLCGFMKLFFSLSVWNGLSTPPPSASFPLKGHMEQAPNPDSSPGSLHFLVWVRQAAIRANVGAYLFWATPFWVSWFFFLSMPWHWQLFPVRYKFLTEN